MAVIRPAQTGLRAPRGTLPPYTNALQHPNNYYGSNSTGSPANQAVYMMPFSVDVQSKTYSGIGVNCTTVPVAGSATLTMTLGLYADDGSGGAPMFTGGPIASGNISPSATGNTFAAVSLTLGFGLYWGAFLYVQSASPTTAPAFTTWAGGSLWIPSTSTIGTQSRTLYLTGQASLPTATTTVTTQLGTAGPLVALRAA